MGPLNQMVTRWPTANSPLPPVRRSITESGCTENHIPSIHDSLLYTFVRGYSTRHRRIVSAGVALHLCHSPVPDMLMDDWSRVERRSSRHIIARSQERIHPSRRNGGNDQDDECKPSPVHPHSLALVTGFELIRLLKPALISPAAQTYLGTTYFSIEVSQRHQDFASERVRGRAIRLDFSSVRRTIRRPGNGVPTWRESRPEAFHGADRSRAFNTPPMSCGCGRNGPCIREASSDPLVCPTKIPFHRTVR